MKYKIFHILPEFGTNTYLVWDENTKEGILIDPANRSKILLNEINKLNLDVKMIINTHGHADHIAGNSYFKEHLRVPIKIHYKDSDMLIDTKSNLSSFGTKNVLSPPADDFIDENTDLKIGKTKIKIIHTPGHTQGGICIYTDKYLFSGDTLFLESIGRTDFPGGSFSDISTSIKNKLFNLPDETIVLPGHGDATTIENEKIANPFVGIASKL